MTAPITNQNYTQQINQAFDFLKNATPQQMQAVGEQVQGNPQSPEAMALAMAAQYQQQMRSAQQPPAPQGTILQQKLGEFQQQAGPAQGGIPAVGMNQMAMQQAVQQDPMRNAGIAAAPENMERASQQPMPQQPQAPQGQIPQGAATGGIAALAHGGEVRHFDSGGFFTSPSEWADKASEQYNTVKDIYGKTGIMGLVRNAGSELADKASERYNTVKDTYGQLDRFTKKQLYGSEGLAEIDAKYAEEQAQKEADNIKSETKTPLLNETDTSPAPASPKKKAVDTMSDFAETPKVVIPAETPKVVIPAEGKDDVIHAPAETSSAKAIANSPSAKEQIKSISDLLGKEPDMTEEVDMAKQYAADARRDKMLGAMTQGIGGMLSAQTPYIGQALGAGLMAGASGYSQGAKDEQAANKDLMALQMAHKKALTSGDRDAAKMYLTDMMAQKTAIAAARAKAQDLKTEHTFRLEEGKQTGQFGLAKEQIRGQLALNLEQFKAKNTQLLEQVKSDIESGGLKPQHQKDIFNALINYGVSPDEAQTMIPGIVKTLTPKYSSNSLGNLGGNRQPLQGGLFFSPAPTQ